MILPKEKAKELVFKYEQYKWINHDLAKQCALIAVEEVIKNQPFKDYGFNFNSISNRLDVIEKYWQEVKQEICDL